MAKVEIIKYQCDVCKAEFKNANDVRETNIPCYGGESNNYHSSCRLDLCNDCSERIRKVIYDNFAQISDYYGIHVKNKPIGE